MIYLNNNLWLLLLLFVLVFIQQPVENEFFTPNEISVNDTVREELREKYENRTPEEWGQNVEGVRTRFKNDGQEIALTLDACSGEYDEDLIHFLQKNEIPATLFLSGVWLQNHTQVAADLAADPLFEIANHGLNHRPCSLTGKSALDIEGTKNFDEAFEEIYRNAEYIKEITGAETKFYRSGTAFYDEVCTALSEGMDHVVAGYTIDGDGGADFSSHEVKQKLLSADAGDIILLHMNQPESSTYEGVGKAIPELIKAGFSFVTLSERTLY